MDVSFNLINLRETQNTPLIDMATGMTLDVTAGTTSALNYKLPTIAFVKR